MRIPIQMLAILGLMLIPSAAFAQVVSTTYWPVNGDTYQVVYAPNGITWYDAEAAAVASGGHLASITSPQENAFVYSLIDNDSQLWTGTVSRSGPWFGGYRTIIDPPNPNTGWAWVDGQPWGYTNWATGQPDDTNGIENVLDFYNPVPFIAPTWNDDYALTPEYSLS